MCVQSLRSFPPRTRGSTAPKIARWYFSLSFSLLEIGWSWGNGRGDGVTSHRCKQENTESSLFCVVHEEEKKRRGARISGRDGAVLLDRLLGIQSHMTIRRAPEWGLTARGQLPRVEAPASADDGGAHPRRPGDGKLDRGAHASGTKPSPGAPTCHQIVRTHRTGERRRPTRKLFFFLCRSPNMTAPLPRLGVSPRRAVLPVPSGSSLRISPLRPAASCLRPFHASAPRRRSGQHFDTLRFVQKLQDEGFTEEQAAALMKVLNDVMEER